MSEDSPTEIGEVPTQIDRTGPAGPVACTPSVSGRVLGKFRLLEELGAGGMGTVYKAHQTDLDRVVALKTIHGASAAGSALLARFQREARAGARLDHPGIVRIFEIGEEAGVQYFAMEFVEGKHLLDQVKASDPPLAERVRWLRDAAFAVQHAHEKGVVHRDLKPQNVLVDTRGQVKVADFGLARDASWQKNATLTLSGVAMGTPHYMSPEQARGEWDTVGPPADVYSLGATLYHVLVGVPPVGGGDVNQILGRVMRGDLVPLRVAAPRIPKDLDTIAMKALAFDPTKRYATIREFAEDLDRFLRFEAILARPASWLERAARGLKRNRKVVLVGAALGVLGVGGLIAWRSLAEGQRLAEEEKEQAREKGRMAEEETRAAVEREQQARARETRARAEELFQKAMNPATILEAATEESSLPPGAERQKDLLRQACSLCPDYEEAYYQLAVVCEGTGEIDEAVGKYEHALASDPGSIRAKARLAILYFFLARSAEDPRQTDAKRLVGELEAEAPGDPHARVAILYQEESLVHGVEAEERRVADELERLAPEVPFARLLLAGMYGFFYHPSGAQSGATVGSIRDLDRALEEIERAVRADPLDILARMNRAMIRLELGDETGAEEDFLAVEANAPRWPEPPHQLAELYFAQGRFEEAAGRARKSVEIEKRDLNLRTLAVALASIGDFEGALLALDEAGKLDPADRDTIVLRALVLQCLGMEEEAKAEAKRAAEQIPFLGDLAKSDEFLASPAAQPVLAAILGRLREFQDLFFFDPADKLVARGLLSLVETVPRIHELRERFVANRTSRHGFTELVTNWSNFEKSAPKLAESLRWLMRELGLKTDPDIVIPLLEFFLKLAKDEELLKRRTLACPRDYLWRAGGHYRRGALDQARTDLEAALELDPASDKAWYGLATIHALKGDAPASAQALRQARLFGFAHLDFATRDADFAKVKDDPAVRAALAGD